MERQAHFAAAFFVEEIYAQGVERIDVFLKVFAREVGVAFHYVDDDGAPGFDVARLGFVKGVEGTDYIRAESAGRSALAMDGDSDGKRL